MSYEAIIARKKTTKHKNKSAGENDPKIEVKHKLTKLRERREGKQKDCRIKMSRKSTSRMITVAISSHLRGKVEMRKEIK